MQNPIFFTKSRGWRRASPEKALREGGAVLVNGRAHVGDAGDAFSLQRSEAARRAKMEMDSAANVAPMPSAPAATVAPMPASGQPPAIDQQTAATLAATSVITPKPVDAPKGAMDGGMMAGEPPAMRETPAMPKAQNPLMPSPPSKARGLNPLAAAKKAKAAARTKICGVPPAVRG